MPTVYTYDPTLVVTTWGPIIFDGFADGDMIEAEHKDDAVMETEGAQGDVAVTINAGRLATVTATLMQGSQTNTKLAPLAASNRQRGMKLIKYPFTITDANSQGSLVKSDIAWIRKAAPYKRSKEHGTSVWIFGLADATIVSAGSITL